MSMSRKEVLVNLMYVSVTEEGLYGVGVQVREGM